MAEVKHTPGPKADVLVKLTNPESGYVSETAAKVTASEWHVIDRVICGSGQLYVAAPDLLAVAIKSHEPYEGLSEDDIRSLYGPEEAELALSLRSALSKATTQQEGR